jgi:hypothetical protein
MIVNPGMAMVVSLLPGKKISPAAGLVNLLPLADQTALLAHLVCHLLTSIRGGEYHHSAGGAASFAPYTIEFLAIQHKGDDHGQGQENLRQSAGQGPECVRKALAAGGKTSKEPEDHGWMYGWSFQDLDGHLWEVISMDLGTLKQG